MVTRTLSTRTIARLIQRAMKAPRVVSSLLHGDLKDATVIERPTTFSNFPANDDIDGRQDGLLDQSSYDGAENRIPLLAPKPPIPIFIISVRHEFGVTTDTFVVCVCGSFHVLLRDLIDEVWAGGGVPFGAQDCGGYEPPSNNKGKGRTLVRFVAQDGETR